MALEAPTRPARPQTRRTAAPAPSQAAAPKSAPQPDVTGSAICLLGLLVTGIFLHGKLPTDIARFAAIGAGLSIAVSLYADVRHGLQNLVRSDVLALVSLYYLTLCEFLFPQPEFVTQVDVPSTTRAIIACLIGFAGLIIGRHLVQFKKQPFATLFTSPVSTTLMLTTFTVCLLVGFSYMLWSVQFDPVLMVRWFMEPRFFQPWSRQALGDLKGLLHELEMFLFLVPPVAGVILARRKRYGFFSLAYVVVGTAFVLFYGFCSGTRYCFAAYLITLLSGFAFSASREQKKEVIVAGVITTSLMLISTVLMLEFRDIGLRAYMMHDYEDFRRPEKSEYSFHVDYNLYAICRIVETFPHRHDYLGSEVPLLALLRPVPRVVWPEKPIGMSLPIEDIIGADGWTVAATFVGEAYMSGGLIAVFLTGCTFGALTRLWNSLASPRNSEFGVLIYASGFFAAAIAMRSMLVLTTALLPSLAGTVAGFFFIRRSTIRQMRTPVPARRDA